jgi:hypothetical protein
MSRKKATALVQTTAERVERAVEEDGPFPETIVQMRLDGTSSAYIRADGPELQETIDRAVRDEREACAAVCDEVALATTKPDNLRASDPRATAKSAACKCAWNIRQRDRS